MKDLQPDAAITDDAAKIAELANIIQAVRDRVRAQYPQPSQPGEPSAQPQGASPIEVPIADLMPLVHARDAAQARIAAIGSVNPRAGGLLNALIQSLKKAIARSLQWFVRDQVAFNQQTVAALEAVMEVLNDHNRALLSLAAQSNAAFGQMNNLLGDVRAEAAAQLASGLAARTAELSAQIEARARDLSVQVDARATELSHHTDARAAALSRNLDALTGRVDLLDPKIDSQSLALSALVEARALELSRQLDARAAELAAQTEDRAAELAAQTDARSAELAALTEARAAELAAQTDTRAAEQAALTEARAAGLAAQTEDRAMALSAQIEARAAEQTTLIERRAIELSAQVDARARDLSAQTDDRSQALANHLDRRIDAFHPILDQHELLKAETTQLKDIRKHWIEWRAEWERKLAANEIQFLRSVADLQGAFQHRSTLMETGFRDIVKAQHTDYLGAIDRATIDIQKRLWHDLEEIRQEYERLIHNELRIIRQRALARSAGLAADPAPGLAATPTAPRFDYGRFAERFRGSEDYVRKNLEIYRPFFSGRSNVLDIGCGRGEFLTLMKELGVPAKGIDLGEESVAHCHLRGVAAEVADLFPWLDAQPEGEFDGIFSAQVVEHLAPESLPEMLRLCASRLRRGGLLAIETPNPECLAIFATHFYLDPTHTRPVPHPLLAFYMEEAGLGLIEVHKLSPALESMPELKDLPPDFRDRFFGGLDYAILGRKL